jgi:hypothetical protein
MVNFTYGVTARLKRPPHTQATWVFDDSGGEISRLVTTAAQHLGRLQRLDQEEPQHTLAQRQQIRNLLERSCVTLASRYRFQQAETLHGSATLWFTQVIRPITRELLSYRDQRNAKRGPHGLPLQLGNLRVQLQYTAHTGPGGQGWLSRAYVFDTRRPANNQPRYRPLRPAQKASEPKAA